MRMPFAQTLARRAFSAAACRHRAGPMTAHIFTLHHRMAAMQSRRRSLSVAPDLGFFSLVRVPAMVLNIARESGADISVIVKEQDLLDIGEAGLTAIVNSRRAATKARGAKGSRQPGRRKPPTEVRRPWPPHCCCRRVNTRLSTPHCRKARRAIAG